MIKAHFIYIILLRFFKFSDKCLGFRLETLQHFQDDI